MIKSIDQFNQKYFNGELSPAILELLNSLPVDEPEVSGFLSRMGAWMRQCHIPAQDFSALLAWMMGSIIPKILPGSWGGMVPPITSEFRHLVVDQYLEKNPWCDSQSVKDFYDVGCGFPPLTTLTTARHFPDWTVTGIDPSFSPIIVYDSDGDYAYFDHESNLKYFQPGVMEVSRWDDMFENVEATRKRFIDLFEKLRGDIPENVGDALFTVERDGQSLWVNPVKSYHSDKVSFLTQGIGDAVAGQADLVRCFNALMYFDLAFKHNTLEWLETVLRPGGIFVCGSNDPFGTTNKYMVYRNEESGINAVEFAFSIENLRPMNMIPYFTLYEDELDTNCLIEACSIIRGDAEFMQHFDQIADRVHAEHEICPRGEDGYLGSVDPDMPAPELAKRCHQISSDLEQHGLVDKAIQVLNGCGIQAWKNQVGHIALTPADLKAFS